jgi:NagD protein
MNENGCRLQEIRALAVDLDGAVYQGNELVPGASDAVHELSALGLCVYFVTNNSMRTGSGIADKLTRPGVPTSQEYVFTNAHAAGFSLSQREDRIANTVLVVGSDGLRTELKRFGLRFVDSPPCHFLVFGLDTTFNYDTLSLALDPLLQGASLVACYRDGRFPAEDNRLRPGCGPMVAVIECAWGTRAQHEIGKPNRLLLDMVADHGNIRPDKILVIGDLPESDIVMTTKFGSPSVLVEATSVSGLQ